MGRLLELAKLVRLRPGPYLRTSALHVDLKGRLEGELLRRLGRLILAHDEHRDRVAATREDLRDFLRELL